MRSRIEGGKGATGRPRPDLRPNKKKGGGILWRNRLEGSGDPEYERSSKRERKGEK